MSLTFDDEKMEIYPTLQDLEGATFGILNSITNTLQVSLVLVGDYFLFCANGPALDFWLFYLQKVQTVQSWLAESTSSFVDAKVADHILISAQATLKTAVERNLEEPDKHFQSYGNII